MAKILVRSAFGYDADAVSDNTGLHCLDETLTSQAEKEEADINTLVRRFRITGEMPQNVRMPVNADFVGILDFKDAMNAIRASEEAFMEMPADVRARFNHDAGALVDFVSDESNRAEAIKLGIVIPPVVENPAPVSAVVEPTAAAVAPAAVSPAK